MKKKKHLQEKSKRSERRVREFQGDREEERGWCFLGRSSGKISLACGHLWCEGHPSYPVCMLMGWQRICSRFYGTKRLREKYLWEQWAKGISVVWNMGNSYGLKRKGDDLSQGPPKRKRDVVQIPAVTETPLVPAENAPSSSGWHSNVVLLLDLIMSFLFTVFPWAFPSYMLKFEFSLLFFILFGCWQFSLTLTTMIAYCPHKASGEGGLVQIWTPNQQLPNHTF